jgi:hypothetical protein
VLRELALCLNQIQEYNSSKLQYNRQKQRAGPNGILAKGTSVKGRSIVDGTATALLGLLSTVQAPERAPTSTILGSSNSEDSRGPLGVVSKDRRRLGRVNYHSRHLIALLRGRSTVVELREAADEISEEPPVAPGAKHGGDDLSAARASYSRH